MEPPDARPMASSRCEVWPGQLLPNMLSNRSNLGSRCQLNQQGFVTEDDKYRRLKGGSKAPDAGTTSQSSSADDVLVKMFEWMIQAPRPPILSKSQPDKIPTSDMPSKSSAPVESKQLHSALIHKGARNRTGKKIRKRVEFLLSQSPETSPTDKQQCESLTSNNATMSSDQTATTSENSTTLDAHDLSGLGSEMDPPTVHVIKASGGDDSRSPGSEKVDPEDTTTSCLPEEIIDNCPSRAMDRLRVAATALSQEMEIIERIQEDIREIEDYAESCGLEDVVGVRKKYANKNGHLMRRCVAPNYKTPDAMPFVILKRALNELASAQFEEGMTSITEDTFRKSVPCDERIPDVSVLQEDTSDDSDEDSQARQERRRKEERRQQRRKEKERKLFKQAGKAWYDIEFMAKPKLLEALKEVVLIEQALPKIMRAACKIAHRWETCEYLQKAGEALDAFLRIARTGNGTDSTRGCMLRALQGKKASSTGAMDNGVNADQWREECCRSSGQWYTIATDISTIQRRVKTWGPQEAAPKSPLAIFAGDEIVSQIFPCPSEFEKLVKTAMSKA